VTPVVVYLAGLILACLVLYALLGGADFGGGVWDLLATGPRADDQRRLIARTMGPIWEANHVWLIAVIVLLFSCFPVAYATIGTALHLPLTVLLVGIVLRGTAFVFRAYDSARDDVFHRWSRVFAVASVVSPVTLGICLGAVASGGVRVDATGTFRQVYVDPWLAPFPLATGVFVLAVFAFLAAVYLTNETDDPALQEAFRVRALGSAVAVTALAWTVFGTAVRGAPHLVDGLWRSAWAPPFQAVTALLGVVLLHALWTRRYGRARAATALQVVLLVLGFGAAQWPDLITPDVRFAEDAAPEPVLWAVAVAMTLGLLVLAPAYLWLFRVFRLGAGAGRSDDGLVR
jgi:cytochrome d ubiquinol oxidase subunit II